MVPPVDLADEAVRLLLADIADPWGTVSPSVYDTARLFSSAPWLDGHQARLDFLLAQQNPDGSWGSPDGYELVPTLSAVEALLAESARSTPAERTIAASAERGLRALRCRLDDPGLTLPDTIGVEFVVPALLEGIAGHGVELTGKSPVLGGELRTAARSVLRDREIPVKVRHTLEALGPGIGTNVVPRHGSVGCSPAATAAWLLGPSDHGEHHRSAARAYLHTVQARYGGPVPSITPITYFERAWVLNSLAVSGLEYRIPAVVLDSLEDGLTDAGLPAAPGLPTDADDTAAALFALAQHGRDRRPDVLLRFRRDGYFACFDSERTPSTSTNAHVLEALGHRVATHPGDRGRYRAAIEMVITWLLDNQFPDGRWEDKWHASAYYATYCCALALAAFGGERAIPAVRRAVRWVLRTQRPDGRWGRWTGTTEETAYMVQLLSRTRPGADAAAAAARGSAALSADDDPGSYPPLWHDKDLYAPVTTIAAARLTALALESSHI